MRAWYIKHVFAIPSSTYSGSSWHDDVPPRLCQSRSCCGSFYVKDVQKETIQEVMNATGITDLQAWGGDRLTYHIYRIVCVWHVSYVHQSPIMYSWYCTCMHACIYAKFTHASYEIMHACMHVYRILHACMHVYRTCVHGVRRWFSTKYKCTKYLHVNIWSFYNLGVSTCNPLRSSWLHIFIYDSRVWNTWGILILNFLGHNQSWTIFTCLVLKSVHRNPGQQAERSEHRLGQTWWTRTGAGDPGCTYTHRTAHCIFGSGSQGCFEA